MTDETAADDLRECAHGLLVRDDDCPDCAEAQTVDSAPAEPVRVSLDELAQASASAPTPLADAHAARVAALRQSRLTTAAGLPRGFQWKPHDTGTRGLAAARRRAQIERRAAKLAKRERQT